MTSVIGNDVRQIKKIEYIFRLVHWLFMHTSHTMLFVSVETKEEAQHK